MKRFIKPVLYLSVITVILVALNMNLAPLKTPEEISYTEFLEKAEYGDIEKIEISGDTIKAYPYDSEDYFLVEYVEDQDFVKSMREQEIQVTKKETNNTNVISLIISLLFSVGPFIFIFWWFNRLTGGMGGGSENSEAGGGFNMLFGAGKSKVKLYKQTDTGVKFSDVAGQEEAKESLSEIIDYLHNASKYSEIGAKLPKGALLIGPPGTGKTLLAKAVAGEANVPFYSITGSDFVEMFVGVGASRVRDMFAEAKKNSPCIVFIDEIDAIGKSRAGSSRTGGNDEREQTLNQLLSEMDGFDATTAVVVLAATNRPEILDKALTRPGRFDRRVIVDKPDLKGREDILKVHAKDVHMDETVNLSAIAKATAGAVGADLSNIINEAALRAVRMKRNLVSQEDLMESVELVFAGKEKKDRVMSEKERKIVAYHEVGHAVVAALQKNSEPVQKITIVPRTSGALGYTMQVPEEEKFLSSKEEMISEIKTLIGGRCAEEVFFNIVTTGASNDIEKVTDLAKKMVTVYGMSEKFDMVAFETQESMYLDTNTFRTCSEEFSAIIDSEMIKLVKACHMDVKNMLIENKELVHEVATVLLDKENITGEEFMEIFRKYHDENYSWKSKVDITDVPDMSTRPVLSHTGALNVSANNSSNEPKKTLYKPDNSSNESKQQELNDTKPLPLKKKEEKNNKPEKTEKEPKNVKSETLQPKKSDDVKSQKTNNNDKIILTKQPELSKKEINSETENVEQINSEPIEELSPPPMMEDFIPPDQDVFEATLLEQMAFDSASTQEEPPMPDFDSIFAQEEETGTKKTTSSDTKKGSDNKKPQTTQEQQEPTKAKPAFEAPKPKPAFEAPKPLQKKKKDKGKQKQQENPKPKQEPPIKQDDVSVEKRDDMALLMDSIKSNPEELAMKGKKGKYINLRAPKNKNEENGILSPETDVKKIKYSTTNINNDGEADVSKEIQVTEDVTEDDY